MKLTEILYEDVKDIWDGYLKHPFVSGIGDGSLSIDRFRFYMLQDYLYLYDYARVYALGIVKSREPEMMQFFSQLVNDTLNGEMDIHRGYMARLGITPEVGHNEGILELLVSILSCSWSYQMIGDALNQIPGAADHPFYGDWIKGYVSEEYVACNQSIMDTVDRLGEHCSDADIAHLKDIFKTCSRFEAFFWDMAWNMTL